MKTDTGQNTKLKYRHRLKKLVTEPNFKPHLTKFDNLCDTI